MTGKKTPVSGPLNRLEDLIRRAGIHIKSSKEPAGSGSCSPPVKPSSIQKKLNRKSTDEEIFWQAMDGIERIFWKNIRHPSSRPDLEPDADSDLEDRKMMQEAMKEGNSIPIPEHPEYIEGWIGVAGKRFLPKLRNGLYSIQGQIDLHGLTQAEARTAVEEYIIRMSRYRSCCIKIIHGRGINSPADRATLKDSLPRVFSTRRMSRYVVAYASAPSSDGGVGSVYVLLSHRNH